MQPELQNQQSYQQVPQTNAALPGVSQQPSGSIGSGPNPATPSPDKTPDDKKQKGPISTQNTLLFSEMRENMIIMSDGSFRAVVECESINFDLMSSREREGIEFSYQNLNVLMDDYMDFIDILAQEANIMDKSFYVVVPYYPAGEENAFKQQTKGLFNSFFSGKKEATVTKIDQVTYTKAKDEIKNRIDSVMNGLFQMGVKSWQLNTRQLGELFYTSYNPDTSSRESLEDIDPSELTTTYVTKGTGPSPRGGRS